MPVLYRILLSYVWNSIFFFFYIETYFTVRYEIAMMNKRIVFRSWNYTLKKNILNLKNIYLTYTVPTKHLLTVYKYLLKKEWKLSQIGQINISLYLIIRALFKQIIY